MGYTSIMKKSFLSLVGAVTLTLTVLVGVAPPANADSTISDVNTLLNSLTVAPNDKAPYDREDFQHWITQSNGCDTRQNVLNRDRTQGVPRGCTVIGGKWYSPYNGVTTLNPGTFDIDHMVPLGEAALSGAYNWSADQRTFFANDLAYKPSLIAVSASSNRSKGDKDPAQWLPPIRSYWCTYLKDWVGVKYRWGLSVDAKEKAAIRMNLTGCDLKMKTPPVAIASNGPDPTSKPSSKPSATPAPPTGVTSDPRFRTCRAANKAGYGPYFKSEDVEYLWYRDSDSDGKVC